jgi:hypothetical protein
MILLYVVCSSNYTVKHYLQDMLMLKASRSNAHFKLFVKTVTDPSNKLIWNAVQFPSDFIFLHIYSIILDMVLLKHSHLATQIGKHLVMWDYDMCSGGKLISFYVAAQQNLLQHVQDYTLTVQASAQF